MRTRSFKLKRRPSIKRRPLHVAKKPTNPMYGHYLAEGGPYDGLTLLLSDGVSVLFSVTRPKPNRFQWSNWSPRELIRWVGRYECAIPHCGNRSASYYEPNARGVCRWREKVRTPKWRENVR